MTANHRADGAPSDWESPPPPFPVARTCQNLWHQGSPAQGVNDASQYIGQAGYGGLRPTRLDDENRARARDGQDDIAAERGGLSQYGEIDSSAEAQAAALNRTGSSSKSSAT